MLTVLWAKFWIKSRGLLEQEPLWYQLQGTSFHWKETGEEGGQDDLWPCPVGLERLLDYLLQAPVDSDVLAVDVEWASHQLEHTRKPTICTPCSGATLKLKMYVESFAGKILDQVQRTFGTRTTKETHLSVLWFLAEFSYISVKWN